MGINIRFTEDEDFEFSNKLAKKLGFTKISIAKGVYEIITSATDFGTVKFNVKDFELLKTNTNATKFTCKMSSLDDGIGIRIAKRKKLTCGGQYVTCTCCCGIGFRCGTTSFGDDGEDDEASDVDKVSLQKSNSQLVTPLNNPRRKKAQFLFNENDRTLTIQFIEKVDWKLLN